MSRTVDLYWFLLLSTSVLIIALYQMPVTSVVVTWLCREEGKVFIQGGEFHILTKLTLYREQLSRPCKYQKGLMKPWGMTVSKVHIIYGLVTVGIRPAIRRHCFWWPESHERTLEFFGQSFVLEHKPSWQPLPHCVILHAHIDTDTCTHVRTLAHRVTREQTNTHAHSAIQLGCLELLQRS